MSAEPMQVLNVHDLNVSLNGRAILRDVNFQLNAGEFTGLIGTNGSGKTTLFRVILGLVAPDSGTLSTPSAHAPNSRASIGYVPQRWELDPDMPVRARDVVGLGLDGQRFGFMRRLRERANVVEEMLVAVGAEQFADRKVGTLSGGEQQRILIAHALVSRPRIVLLDEPFANLDPANTDEIVTLLHRLSKANNIAVFLSSHELNPLLGVLDRVVYIAYGRVASGSTSEVVRTDVLSELYGHHVDVVQIHGRTLIVPGTSDSSPVDDHPPLVVE